MIRSATDADVSEIGALIRELAGYEQRADEVRWTEAELSDALFGRDAVPRVLIAETPGGDIAGFALWFPTFSTFRGAPGIWLEDLYVRPEHRRHGHGRALLDALRNHTDQRVEWSVLDWNELAQTFYRGLGAFPLHEWTTWRWLPAAETPET